MRIFAFLAVLLLAAACTQCQDAEAHPQQATASEMASNLPEDTLANATIPAPAPSPPLPPLKRAKVLPFRKLRVMALGDERLCGNSTMQQRTGLAMLREMFMFDDLMIEYVGNQVDNVTGFHHECHVNYTTSQVRYGSGKAKCPPQGCLLWDWKKTWTPYDVVILMFGSHDCIDTVDPVYLFSVQFETLERIVMAMRGGGHGITYVNVDGQVQGRVGSVQPPPGQGTKVFLTHLPSVRDPFVAVTIREYNEAISFLVGEVTDSGELGDIPVSIVPLNNWNTTTDLEPEESGFGTMPSEEGQRKMALGWYTAIHEWMAELEEKGITGV